MTKSSKLLSGYVCNVSDVSHRQDVASLLTMSSENRKITA